jgi:hypothetical protein
VIVVIINFLFFMADGPEIVQGLYDKFRDRHSLPEPIHYDLTPIDRAITDLPSDLYADSLMSQLEKQWDEQHPDPQETIDKLRSQLADAKNKIRRLEDFRDKRYGLDTMVLPEGVSVHTLEGKQRTIVTERPTPLFGRDGMPSPEVSFSNVEQLIADYRREYAMGMRDGNVLEYLQKHATGELRKRVWEY